MENVVIQYQDLVYSDQHYVPDKSQLVTTVKISILPLLC